MALCSPTFPSTSAVVAGAATKRGCSTLIVYTPHQIKRICLNNKISALVVLVLKDFIILLYHPKKKILNLIPIMVHNPHLKLFKSEGNLFLHENPVLFLQSLSSETEIENLDCSTVHYTDSQDDGNVIITILFLLLTGMLELVALNI